MRILLNWIKSTYGDPEIVVTENGYPDYGGLNDTRRLDYHRVSKQTLLVNLDWLCKLNILWIPILSLSSFSCSKTAHQKM